MGDPKLLITVAAAAGLFITVLKDPRNRRLVLLAAAVSAAVNAFVPHVYVVPDALQLGGTFSTFSFVAGTAGFVALGMLFRRYRGCCRLPMLAVVYVAGLLVIEFVGYHLLGIQLVGNEPSFLGLGVLHGTPRLHITYVAAGPLMLAVLTLLERR